MGKRWQTALMVLSAVFLCQSTPELHYTPAATQASAEEMVFSVQVHKSDTEHELQFEIIRPEPGHAVSLKQILIYHTHTYEAYQQDQQDKYVQLEQWRTKDEQHNIVAVGRALTAALEALGFQVTHDTTAFEPPSLTDAYDRSLSMLEERGKSGEKYDLYIDLHRDALASSNSILRTVSVGDTEIARFMVLVGQGTTGGYAEKPDWLSNKALADAITAALNDQIDGLARDVKVKTGRFNQHVANCCVLIECGTNWNTLQEVLNGIPYLAQAISTALGQE